MASQKGRVKRKKDEARQRILDAAEYLFFQKKSYDKTTIRDIAEVADVSTGAVYTHFSSKQDLLAVIIHQFFSEYEQATLQILEAEATGIEKVKIYIDYISQILEQPKSQRLLHYMIRLDPNDIESNLLASFRERGQRVHESITEMIRIGQKDGTVAELGSPELIAYTFMHLLQGLIQGLTGRSLTEAWVPFFSADEVITQLKRMLIAAIRTNKTFHREITKTY